MDTKKEDYFTEEAKKPEELPQSQSKSQPAQPTWQEAINRLSHSGIANLEKIMLLQQMIQEQKKSQDILIDFGKKLFAELNEIKANLNPKTK